MLDSLDTAIGFGFTGDNVEVEMELFTLADLYAPNHPGAERALAFANSWVLLTTC